MAAGHSASFLALVNEAKARIKQVYAREMPEILKRNPAAKLIDVREESEYAAGHVRGAEWLGKGILERDIEEQHPDKKEALYLYCGGGFRSALSADNLQKMGYTNVYSVDGGWRGLKELLPTEK
jgi:rhodanese-related sulfurtransferase